jgi:RNA polymerase sigma-70 factor, ECF subfamily
MSDFGRLVGQEIPRLRRYARALTRDRERADDMVQTCLLRALAKQHLWAPGSDLRAWLFTILHNERVSELRRSVREEVRNESAVALLTPAPMRSDDRLDLRDVDRAVGKLPDRQRAILLLIARDGMSYGQVAAVFNLPVGTVRSRLGRARAALRAELDRPLTRHLTGTSNARVRKSDKARSKFPRLSGSRAACETRTA